MEKRILICLSLLVVLVLVILRSVSFFPYPEMLTETYFLSQGMKPYAQINDVHFPGVMLLPINLYTLGIRTVMHLRFIHTLLLVTNLFLILLVLKSLGKSSFFRIFLALTSYLFFFFLWEGNILWIDSFVATLSLLGFYLLITTWYKKSPINALITGLIFGLLLLFKQHGIFICLTATLWVYLATKSLKRTIVLTIAWLIPMGLALIYVVSLGVISDFLFWTLLHNFQGYIGLEGKTPSLFSLAKLGLLFFPAILGISFSSRLRANKYLILLYFGSALFYNFPRFELLHSQVALPIMIIGLFLALDSAHTPIKLFALSCIFTGWVLTARFFSKDIPGKVFFYTDSSKATIEFAKHNTSPGETIYVYGVNDNVYYLSLTTPPQKIWIELLPGNIIPGVQEVIINTLTYDHPKLILVDPNSKIDGKTLTSFTPLIWQHITSNYVLKNTLSNQVQVWRLKTL